MNIQGVVDKVREIMNEAGASNSLNLLSEDHIKIDTYILSTIPDAVNYLSRAASLNMLNQSDGEVVDITTEEGYSSLTLPSDFLRLAGLKLKGWKRAVYSIYEMGSEQYNIQQNEHTRAGMNKPVCVYVSSDTVECYPSGRFEFLRYIKKADSSDLESSLDVLKSDLDTPLCYWCAALVYDIFQQSATADRMRAIAQAYLQ